MRHGWGSRSSDKHVTEKSGLLNKLLPGDLVLADRGFDIRDSVGLVCVCVGRSENTCIHMRTQPTGCKICRGIAHLRVHVEREIRCVHTKYVDYTILNGLVPVSMVLPCQGEDMTFLDKIMTVCCCALTNVCPNVVMKP